MRIVQLDSRLSEHWSSLSHPCAVEDFDKNCVFNNAGRWYGLTGTQNGKQTLKGRRSSDPYCNSLKNHGLCETEPASPIRDAQPAWLRKARSFQKRRRALELHAESCRQAVAVARQYRQHLESRGRAYGDPVVALEVLEQQRQTAEEAVQDLECKRIAFLATQAKAEVSSQR